MFGSHFLIDCDLTIVLLAYATNVSLGVLIFSYFKELINGNLAIVNCTLFMIVEAVNVLLDLVEIAHSYMIYQLTHVKILTENLAI